ncbi:MAG TPA: sugar O-acetyltransferase [Candidatus Akkermansia intestinavium]|nr:sugar O-acetyltransferase [Candidatus Akkermansia intestinavium]
MERSEQSKMLRGELFDANDSELLALRVQAKHLCYQFNHTDPADEATQRDILSRLIGRIRGQAMIMPNFWCDYGSNIELGDGVFINHDCVILDGGKVTFGDNVLVGPQCGFYTASHPADAETRRTGAEYSLPISIDAGVWIGGGVKVLPGVHIGENSIIAGGSVVTRDVPANVLAGGVPCRVIRPLSAPEQQPLPGMERFRAAHQEG